MPVVRFCGRRFEGGEVTASFLFDGHAEGAQDAPGSFDDSNADSGAVGDGLAGGGDAAPGLSLCQGGMCDGDSECCFGADGVFLAEFGAGGGVEQGSDLVLPLGTARPDGGSGMLASGYWQSPGVSSLPAFGVQRFDAGDVFGGLTYCCGPCVGVFCRASGSTRGGGVGMRRAESAVFVNCCAWFRVCATLRQDLHGFVPSGICSTEVEAANFFFTSYDRSPARLSFSSTNFVSQTPARGFRRIWGGTAAMELDIEVVHMRVLSGVQKAFR